jgi:hypothetical protein
MSAFYQGVTREQRREFIALVIAQIDSVFYVHR